MLTVRAIERTTSIAPHTSLTSPHSAVISSELNKTKLTKTLYRRETCLERRWQMEVKRRLCAQCRLVASEINTSMRLRARVPEMVHCAYISLFVFLPLFIYLFIYYSFISVLKYVSMDNKCEKFYLTICFEDDTVLTTEVGISL